MPAYKKTAKYNKQQTAIMEGEILYIISHSSEAITIDEMRAQSFTLADVSTQKIARILTKLIEMGMVIKAKSKSKNKMVYKSVAIMEEQGYN